MTRKIKMIWDFYGPDALQIAKHHSVHLGQFGTKHKLTTSKAGVEEITVAHHLAFLVIEEKDLVLVRDALRPHRALLADDAVQ